ncbi:MAG: hypothetical protein HFH86_00920 [Bacilli bacterium]|jgi:tight adherence protein B|nr:hypothetical protein [Bacilli bacterium]
MEGFIWQVFVIQVFTILALFATILFLLRESKSIKYQKRFERFALLSVKDYEKSFFDILLTKTWIIIHKISKSFSKSVFLKKYSEKYEKHITFEEKDFKSGMDYVTIKFLTAFCFVIFNMLTIMFQYAKIGFISSILAFFIGFFVPDLILNIQFKQKRKRVEDDLLKAIIIMNNSFKSGRNIMQAVEIVKNELNGPISDEFKKIYMDMTYGLSLDVVFNRFYERVKLEDAKYITSSLTLLNRTGGNIVRVFSTIEKSFFDKKKLLNEMKSLTAASIFVFRVLIALPFLFSFLIFLMNPNYFNPFFETPVGIILFILTIILYICYVLTIKKVLKVKM